MTTIEAGPPLWPTMRGDARNTGASALSRPRATSPSGSPGAPASPRRLRTGNSIFSTPVIAADETVLVGSADGVFYAWDPREDRVRWRHATRECIDCAAAIDEQGRIYAASCDATLTALSPEGALLWRFDVAARRAGPSPSTIYWFEGNVALGPEGLVYAGNDDFYLYALDRETGALRWAFPTGCNIWSIPALDETGALYFTSFDLFLYALDARTGAVRWRRRLPNFAAASVAIAPGGALLVGTFEGALLALDPRDGRERARFRTGGPIYASAATAPDGTVFVGSSDGIFYALEPDLSRARWSFDAGDPIRASASLAPDPEGRAPYLVVVGDGRGILHAFEPGGARRWAFDTRVGAASCDYPNLNASAAVGAQGIATASASGDVLYVPHEAYLADPPAPGMTRAPRDARPRDGAFLLAVSPGGTPDEAPLPASGPASGSTPSKDGVTRRVMPLETVSVRALLRRGGASVPARIEAASLRVQGAPEGTLRTLLQADGAEAALLPTEGALLGSEGAAPGAARALTVEATLVEADGARHPVRARLGLEARAAEAAPTLHDLPRHPFRVHRMAVYAPAIVPSFDQIGIASLRIDVRVVHVADGASEGRCIAFGVKKFGVSEAGELVGVPVPRVLLYAFRGAYRDGHLLLEAERCRFEITAAALPLERLRLSGSFSRALAPELGASLAAEARLPRPGELLAGALAGIARGRSGSWLLRYARSFLAGPGPGAGPRGVGGVVAGLASLGALLASLGRMAPLARAILTGGLHRPWGLLDGEGRFRGVGTFRATRLPDERLRPPAGAGKVDVSFDRRRGTVVAAIAWEAALAPAPAASLAILLVDLERCRPLDVALDAATDVERDARGSPVRCTLRAGAALSRSRAPVRAIVLLDLAVVAELDIGVRA